MTVKASVIVDRARGLRPFNRMIFGHFIEHFHTQVYGGIYDPGNPLSDERGFRKDVLDAMRDLGAPVVRWPGGNFVSDYHWRDAVGPDRTPTYNMAWRVPEPNSFGTDEFMAWSRELGAEPYICTNGGNGTSQEMSDWVEYCNGAYDTKTANLRRENGHNAPYAVKYWGIGNESYGDWQIGAKTVSEWGPYVAESAKMMRRVDPSIVLSAAALPDIDWTLALLRSAGRYLDLVSIHDYWDYTWQKDEPSDYLTCILRSEKPEKLIEDTKAILRVSGFANKIGIAFDEWNLRGWHHPEGNSPEIIAVRDRNDIAATYTMADAIFSASFLNACLRHSDAVQMANVAPSVNARGPIFVHKDGIVKRTSYHALKLYTDHVLPLLGDTFVDSDKLSRDGETVSVVDAVASSTGSNGEIQLMLVNRHPDSTTNVSLRLDGAWPTGQYAATRLGGEGTDLFNDINNPERVVPHTITLDVQDGMVSLPPHSITAVTL